MYSVKNNALNILFGPFEKLPLTAATVKILKKKKIKQKQWKVSLGTLAENDFVIVHLIHFYGLILQFWLYNVANFD